MKTCILIGEWGPPTLPFALQVKRILVFLELQLDGNMERPPPLSMEQLKVMFRRTISNDDTKS